MKGPTGDSNPHRGEAPPQGIHYRREGLTGDPHRTHTVKREPGHAHKDTTRTTPHDHKKEYPPHLKVPCKYKVSAMGKFALLMYMSEFRPRIASF